ncbi:hypothetical protein D3C73_1276570 [compost metagenome]
MAAFGVQSQGQARLTEQDGLDPRHGGLGEGKAARLATKAQSQAEQGGARRDQGRGAGQAAARRRRSNGQGGD